MAVHLSHLRAAVPGLSMITGEDVAGRSATWGVFTPSAAKAILRPRTAGEVSAILKLCHKARQPVVAGGGITGLVQGAIAGKDEYQLSLELMNKVEEVDALNRVAVVQAGTPLETVQKAAEEAGLDFPVDIGARGGATIGGMIATNAGGNHVVRYGMMRESVLGLEAVLADGTVVSSMNRVLKNNAGYDLKQLFIGSEGTLGVVTRAVLRLRERPRGTSSAFVALPSFEHVIGLLKTVDSTLSGTLTTFELMWNNFYRLVTTPPAPGRPPLSQDHPFYALVEAGAANGADREKLERVLMRCLDEGIVSDAVIAKSEAERGDFWALRDDVAQVLQFGTLFAFDVSLPITEMDAYVKQVEDDLRARWPETQLVVFGHVGDGNIHIVAGVGSDDADTRHQVEEIVYRPLAPIGGTVSAEHGIGLEKKPWLHLTRGPEEIELMRRLKNALDPHNILNPGKIFDPA
ncbi:MAG: FAD-binding oxidoreductase [Alphaproteobacteria bacterium]